MGLSVLRRISVLATTTLPILLCLALLTISSDAAEKKKKKGMKEKEDVVETPVTELDPEGAPPDRKVPAARIFVWYEGGLWHVRTRTKENAHQFSGVISIAGGKLKHISNYEGLEARGKKKGKKGSDIGQWNAAKNQITFNFRTAGREDGFDFELDKKAKDVTFDLKVDGYGHARVIRVGSKEQMPSATPFTLPAQPGAKPAEEAK
ncbi:MAG: hypothetical protein AB7O26_08940 [Planctomycetaceae bacterium]